MLSQTDRQTHRQTDKQTDKQTKRHSDIKCQMLSWSTSKKYKLDPTRAMLYHSYFENPQQLTVDSLPLSS